MIVHLTELRLALGLVMATFPIKLFVSASHPAVTSDAWETGDWPTHWPGFRHRNHSRNSTFRSHTSPNSVQMIDTGMAAAPADGACLQAFSGGMEMSQQKTLGVVIAALLILLPFGLASAQAVPCDNSEAPSVIPTGDDGEPATSEQIEDTFSSTIRAGDIADCLRARKGLVNHVIDYPDYAAAFNNVLSQGGADWDPVLVIRDSVLWSPYGRAVDLWRLGKERNVGHSILWRDVVLGPGVSGRNTVFHGSIDLEGVTLHGRVDFIDAHFREAAEFGGLTFAQGAKVSFAGSVFNDNAYFGGARFTGGARFQRVQFDKKALFHEAVFSRQAIFLRAQFHGFADFRDVRFEAESSNVFRSCVFDDEADFARARFTGAAGFQNAQFRKEAYFGSTVFSKRADFGRAQFHGSADFEDARFEEEARADFRDSVFNDEAGFGGARFTGGTRFQRVQFNKGASFQNALFIQQTTFESAQFRQHAEFDGVTFAEGAKVSFAGGIFDAEAGFGGIIFPGPTTFQKAVFNMGASFQKAVFNQQADFEGVQFGQHADFGGVTFAEGVAAFFPGSVFGGAASFALARFTGPTQFQDAQFKLGASFQNASFSQQAYFERAQFRQHAEFDDVIFAEGAKVSFARSVFDGWAVFGGARFTGAARFQRVQFNKGASFWQAVFSQQAIFEGASFVGDSSFREAEIKGALRLVDTTWGGRGDFRRSIIANLDWDSENRPSTVKGVFDAQGAVLRSMTIKDVHFSDLADFSGATFVKARRGTLDNVLFENVIFERSADFLRTRFLADAIFLRNRFRGLLDFTGAPFAKHARLCLLDNRIGQLNMEREHLNRTPPWQFSRKPLEESRFRTVKATTFKTVTTYSCAEPNQSNGNHEHLPKIYRSIEASFRSANDRWGENEAWYLGVVASRKTQGRVWNAVSRVFLDFPSRYGIDYVRALMVSAVLVLFFWALYWLYFRFVLPKKRQRSPCIKLAAPPEQRRALRFRPFERVFHRKRRKTRPLRPLQDALFLSWRAFLKLGLGSSYPPVLAWLVYVQWVLGMYMLIHFLFVLKNTLPIALPFIGG